MSRKVLIGLVCFVFMVFPLSAAAIDSADGYDPNMDMQFSMNVDTTVQMVAYANLACERFSVGAYLDVDSDGPLLVDGLVDAVAKNDQFPEKNDTGNWDTQNNAWISESSMNGVEGNIGVNVAGGNNNTQSNIAVYAAGEEEQSLTRAVAYSVQKAMDNSTHNEGAANHSSITNDVLNGATGNIGVNVATGNNNAQTNMTSIAVAPAKVGLAFAYVQQKSLQNCNYNVPSMIEDQIGTVPELTGTVSFPGLVTLYQVDNFYLDVWEGTLPHPNDGAAGHIDIDGEIQNAVDNPYRGDNADGDNIGGLAFEGALPDGVLSITTGEVPIYGYVVNNLTVNNASIADNVMNGASGNFGVNVAAGNNNLQANAFTACYVPGSNGPGNGE